MRVLSVEMAQQQQQHQRRSRQQLEAATEDTPDAEKDVQHEAATENKPDADKDAPASKRRRNAYI